MSPLRGVKHDMEKHLQSCVYNPNATLEIEHLGKTRHTSQNRIESAQNPFVLADESQSSYEGIHPIDKIESIQKQETDSRLAFTPQRQTILRLERSSQRSLTKEDLAKFQRDFLRFSIAIGASFNSADHPESKACFMKWLGLPTPSRKVLKL